MVAGLSAFEWLVCIAHVIGLVFPIICCWLLYEIKKDVWQMKIRIGAFWQFYEKELGCVAKFKFVEALHEQWEEEGSYQQGRRVQNYGTREDA